MDLLLCLAFVRRMGSGGALQVSNGAVRRSFVPTSVVQMRNLVEGDEHCSLCGHLLPGCLMGKLRRTLDQCTEKYISMMSALLYSYQPSSNISQINQLRNLETRYLTLPKQQLHLFALHPDHHAQRLSRLEEGRWIQVRNCH